jgi:hypothetical protein
MVFNLNEYSCATSNGKVHEIFRYNLQFFFGYGIHVSLMLYMYVGSSYIRKWVGNMLFRYNTTNQTNRWQHKPLRTSSGKGVLKIKRVMYTQHQLYTESEHGRILDCLHQTELRSWETWFCHLHQWQHSYHLPVCFRRISRWNKMCLQTNLVRRNLARGLTVGAANGGVLATFLWLTGSDGGSGFFVKTDTAVSCRLCNDGSFELQREVSWGTISWSTMDKKEGSVHNKCEGRTSLADVVIYQPMPHMIQASHVLDPSENWGLRGQQDPQTCHQ